MSTEVAQQDSDLTVLPPARPMNHAAVEQLKLDAESMGAAKQLADVLCATDMVPAAFKNKPDNGAAAILYGAEIGLNPIQSLQQIFVVQGKPAIYARTMVALVERNGCIVQTVASDDNSVTVHGRDTRTGKEEVSTWDYERAKKAGYTQNKKYDTDPQAMLYAKAATEVCRKLAPGVLLGISMSREEAELDFGQPRHVANEAGAPRGVDALRSKLGIAAEPAAESEAEADPKLDADNVIGAIEKATSIEVLDAIAKQIAGKFTGADLNRIKKAGESRRAELEGK